MAVTFDLSFVTPLGSSDLITGFIQDHRETWIFILLFITITKLQFQIRNESNFMVGVTATQGTVLNL